MSSAGPCGWSTLFPPVAVVASVGVPSVRSSRPFLLKTLMSGVNGLACPGNLCWKTASSLRSEEHTSELQSRFDLVCRLLLEKKKKHKDRGTLDGGRRQIHAYFRTHAQQYCGR